MAGPTPIIANFRLISAYTVSGETHNLQHYLDCTASGDPSGFNTQARSGHAPVGVSTLADAIFNHIKIFYDPTYSTFNGWTLFQRVGTTFVPLSSGSSAVVATGSGQLQPANQLALSGKDTAEKNLPVYFYEGLFGNASKFQSISVISPAAQALVNAYWNTAGTAADTDPWAWRVSRGGVFAKRWIAIITDTNEKLRRLRGIK